MSNVHLAHEVRRRARELALAYRIAAARVQARADRERLMAYERASERLVVELAASMGCEMDGDPARLSPEWLMVGTMRDEPSILRAIHHLEEKLARRLERVGHVDAARRSEDRRSWLVHRADLLASLPRAS